MQSCEKRLGSLRFKLQKQIKGESSFARKMLQGLGKDEDEGKVVSAATSGKGAFARALSRTKVISREARDGEVAVLDDVLQDATDAVSRAEMPAGLEGEGWHEVLNDDAQITKKTESRAKIPSGFEGEGWNEMPDDDDDDDGPNPVQVISTARVSSRAARKGIASGDGRVVNRGKHNKVPDVDLLASAPDVQSEGRGNDIPANLEQQGNALGGGSLASAPDVQTESMEDDPAEKLKKQARIPAGVTISWEPDLLSSGIRKASELKEQEGVLHGESLSSLPDLRGSPPEVMCGGGALNLGACNLPPEDDVEEAPVAGTQKARDALISGGWMMEPD